MSGGDTATVATHADWSIDPRKRGMTVAVRDGRFWQVAAPVPVGELHTLFARLRGLAAGGAVALGVDFPVGLPRAYAARRTEADFPAFLRGCVARGDFFRVCATLEEVA